MGEPRSQWPKAPGAAASHTVHMGFSPFLVPVSLECLRGPWDEYALKTRLTQSLSLHGSPSCKALSVT